MKYFVMVEFAVEADSLFNAEEIAENLETNIESMLSDNPHSIELIGTDSVAKMDSED